MRKVCVWCVLKSCLNSNALVLLWDCSAVWFRGKVAGSVQPHVDYHPSTCLCAGWLSHCLNKSGWCRLRCVRNLNRPLSWQVEDSPREAARLHVTPPRSPDARGNQDCHAISLQFSLFPLKRLPKWLLWASSAVKGGFEISPDICSGESLVFQECCWHSCVHSSQCREASTDTTSFSVMILRADPVLFSSPIRRETLQVLALRQSVQPEGGVADSHGEAHRREASPLHFLPCLLLPEGEPALPRSTGSFRGNSHIHHTMPPSFLELSPSALWFCLSFCAHGSRKRHNTDVIMMRCNITSCLTDLWKSRAKEGMNAKLDSAGGFLYTTVGGEIWVVVSGNFLCTCSAHTVLSKPPGFQLVIFCAFWQRK